MMQEPYRNTLGFGNPFLFEELYAHPGPLTALDTTGPRKSVAVIGAGVAGLAAAYELEQNGHSVVLFEESGRVGGRIRTHRFSNGAYAEVGAMRIPANHACTLHYVREFGLTLRPFVNQNPRAIYYVRGQRSTLEDWRTIANRFDLPESKRIDPQELYASLMQKAMTWLSSDDKWEMFRNNMESHRLLRYANQSLWQYLEGEIDAETIDYIGSCTAMIQYEQASFLETLIDYLGLFQVGQYEIDGGMDELVRAFVERIGGTIYTGHSVKAISVGNDDVSITLEHDGEIRAMRFDYVICTVPAPACDLIDFSPPLPTRKQQALRRVSYASAAKTIVATRDRFWELRDGIYGGGSYTDLPIRQCWYPNDNARPLDGPLLARFSGDDEDGFARAPLRWGPRDSEVSHSPSAMTASYTWEAGARRMLALTEGRKETVVLDHLELVHPGARPSVVESMTHVWDAEQSPGCGAFAYFAPGDHSRYQSLLCEPHPARNPRVFFAGEHLAVAHAWIQGSIQTALIAAEDVLRAPSPAYAQPPHALEGFRP